MSPSIHEQSIEQLIKVPDHGLANAMEAFRNGFELEVLPTTTNEVPVVKGEEKRESRGTFTVNSLVEGACSWSNAQTIYVHMKNSASLAN